jgi:hypothetical protein
MFDVVARVGHQANPVSMAVLRNQLLKQGCLSKTRLSGENHKRRLAQEAVLQQTVRGLMFRTGVQKTAVRKKGEWFRL